MLSVRSLVVLVLCMISFPGFAQSSKVYEVLKGEVSFRSEAPKELISASSDQLRGLIDIQKRTFAFKIPMSSFLGFNSKLQQEHFNENYLETNVYADATFRGKIVEDVDLSKEGEYTVRAKGQMSIHGVQAERIVQADVRVKNGTLSISSAFTVGLSDHNIKIPRLVFEKLSSEIKVALSATLKPKI
ncbi:MAG: YceI family protein [Flavipsychrobacter sp.]|nr:YceI family protein [Flavipsychrobacter sp.]